MSHPADDHRPEGPDEGQQQSQYPGQQNEPPAYGASIYGDQAYGAPSYDAQQFGAQSYGSQPYGAAGYAAPGYAAPGYGAQAYGAQPYGAPGYGAVQPYGYAPQVARKDPALMLVASFFIAGLGTILNGETGKGIGILCGYFFGVLTSWVVIGIPIMLGFWIWGMIDAYNGAKDHNARHGLP